MEALTLAALRAGYIPFCIGGDNSQSYCACTRCSVRSPAPPSPFGCIENWLAVSSTIPQSHNPRVTKAFRSLPDPSLPSPGHASAWLTYRAETTGYTGGSSGMGGTVINLDAHLDVRPYLEGGLHHSGSPFFALLEDSRFQGKLVEFAAQGAQCSAVSIHDRHPPSPSLPLPVPARPLSHAHAPSHRKQRWQWCTLGVSLPMHVAFCHNQPDTFTDTNTNTHTQLHSSRTH